VADCSASTIAHRSGLPWRCECPVCELPPRASGFTRCGEIRQRCSDLPDLLARRCFAGTGSQSLAGDSDGGHGGRGSPGIAAFLLAFIPLPTQQVGFGTAWCGPGAASESAVLVLINPDSVNSGDAASGADTSTPAYQQQAEQFKALCTGVATSRLQECAVLLAVGAALAIASVAFLTYRPRWLLDG